MYHNVTATTISSLSPPSVTTITTHTISCHYFHHSHHHLSQSHWYSDGVKELLLYGNSCSYSSLLCVESKSPPKCNVFCMASFKERKICEEHKGIHSTWVWNLLVIVVQNWVWGVFIELVFLIINKHFILGSYQTLCPSVSACLRRKFSYFPLGCFIMALFSNFELGMHRFVLRDIEHTVIFLVIFGRHLHCPGSHCYLPTC